MEANSSKAQAIYFVPYLSNRYPNQIKLYHSNPTYLFNDFTILYCQSLRNTITTIHLQHNSHIKNHNIFYGLFNGLWICSSYVKPYTGLYVCLVGWPQKLSNRHNERTIKTGREYNRHSFRMHTVFVFAHRKNNLNLHFLFASQRLPGRVCLICCCFFFFYTSSLAKCHYET